mmetsp:Transcript_172981/g.554615  ORF Transcript_172981/g.554615 Transcript_172981/m.554615 type:complete len:207 (-) Transcript_172981:594-1214(-)
MHIPEHSNLIGEDLPRQSFLLLAAAAARRGATRAQHVVHAALLAQLLALQGLHILADCRQCTRELPHIPAKLRVRCCCCDRSICNRRVCPRGDVPRPAALRGAALQARRLLQELPPELRERDSERLHAGVDEGAKARGDGGLHFPTHLRSAILHSRGTLGPETRLRIPRRPGGSCKRLRLRSAQARGCGGARSGRCHIRRGRRRAG